MINLIEGLTKARALIADPKNWNQGYLTAFHGEDVTYCAVGAVSAAVTGNALDRNINDFSPQLKALQAALPDASPVQGNDTDAFYYAWDAVARYNNSHGHKEVLAVFDRAIAANSTAH